MATEAKFVVAWNILKVAVVTIVTSAVTLFFESIFWTVLGLLMESFRFMYKLIAHFMAIARPGPFANENADPAKNFQQLPEPPASPYV